MKIQILGGHGGLSKGHSTTSFLIDDKLLIDAGAVASTLSVEEQSKIDHILISHCHLDHIKDLAFLCDNCFGMRKKPFEVFTHETVKKIIKAHLFNNIIWPDFSELPSVESPTINFNSIKEEVKLRIGDFDITPIKVKHAHDAMGFIIEKDQVAILFTLDTGPTDRIWGIARKIKNLKAIFTEVSFPNSLEKVAEVSDHHTANSLKTEMSKMPEHIPVILTHLKPSYREIILKEIQEMKEDRIRVLSRDGEIFNF
jgi:ribonuclease BN (tRNA processing enzyme)